MSFLFKMFKKPGLSGLSLLRVISIASKTPWEYLALYHFLKTAQVFRKYLKIKLQFHFWPGASYYFGILFEANELELQSLLLFGWSGKRLSFKFNHNWWLRIFDLHECFQGMSQCLFSRDLILMHIIKLMEILKSGR